MGWIRRDAREGGGTARPYSGIVHKGKKGERKGKGQTEEVSEKKGRRGEKNKEKR